MSQKRGNTPYAVASAAVGIVCSSIGPPRIHKFCSVHSQSIRCRRQAASCRNKQQLILTCTGLRCINVNGTLHQNSRLCDLNTARIKSPFWLCFSALSSASAPTLASFRPMPPKLDLNKTHTYVYYCYRSLSCFLIFSFSDTLLRSCLTMLGPEINQAYTKGNL